MSDLDFWNEEAKAHYMWAIASSDDPEVFNVSCKEPASIVCSVVPESERGIIVDYGAGAGAGRISKWLAQSFKKVIAFDWSEEMLKRMAPLPNVEPCLSLDGIVADVAFSSNVFFHHVHEDLPAQFGAVAKCLKPGGCFILQLPVYEIEVDRDRRYPGGICTVTESHMRDLMTNAGFEIGHIDVTPGRYVIGENPHQHHWSYHVAYKTT